MKIFHGINLNVIKSTINEHILFHLKIGFLCRKPKQYIQKDVSGLLGSYFLGTTLRRKTHKNIQIKSLFSFYILDNNTKKIIFFLELSRVRSSSHRYKKMVTFISGPV